MEEPQKDHIVMTPKRKTATSTTLAIERRAAVNNTNPGSDKVHVAGGDHRGIVINKEVTQDGDNSPAQLSLEFRVFLVSGQTGKHTQESRTLQFWFITNLSESDQASVAQEFFKELVSPQEFPRDYVGFIKKVMKLLQHGYSSLKKVEVTLTQLDEVETPPNRPSRLDAVLITLGTRYRADSVSADESSLGKVVPLTEEKVLELLESAYPNPITVVDMARENGWAEDEVALHLAQLQEKGLVKSLEHGAFTRVGQGDTDIQVVKQMPTMTSSKQPTIAIITAQYCEKLAVDAMIENKETFVRYTTVVENFEAYNFLVGESNVYTLGNIGAHRIVCTKLPTVGHTREAMTAAGNTTTRLLGTFQKVDHVFLVGVGGGVPHFTDYNKHVRLGDVVVSHPIEGHKYVYVYCENTKSTGAGTYEFETKAYSPANLGLQEIAVKLKLQHLISFRLVLSATETTCSENAAPFRLPPLIPTNTTNVSFPPSPSSNFIKPMLLAFYQNNFYSSITKSESEDCSIPWLKYLKEGLSSLGPESEQDFNQPPPESDKLYMSIGERDLIEVAHPAPLEGATKRQEGCPRLYLAPIASGRAVAREDQLRQQFSSQFGTLAFDSEFDAVVDSVIGNCRDSFVVLRGIADYKDGTRRKEWQPYASLVAASVMKAIICGMDAPADA
uniref:Winged helix-turn-helix domain-containing protein n=1 Tax=Timema tahoe TaxID=61484 RepID=A0A7R9NXT2_9NEOP|nr:unnamed protein product [Timema tahoe]